MLSEEADSASSSSAAAVPYRELLQEYHSSFHRTCGFLRVANTLNLTLTQLAEDFAHFFVPGVILADRLVRRTVKGNDDAQPSDACLALLKRIKDDSLCEEIARMEVVRSSSSRT